MGDAHHCSGPPVSKMTYTVSSGTLNPTIPYHFDVCVVLLPRDSFFRLCYFYVMYVFCRLVVLVRLSVPVQVIDWKDSSPK